VATQPGRDQEKSQRVEDLFWRASSLPAEARQRFLIEQCRDEPELVQDLELLLAEAERVSSPLDRPVVRFHETGLAEILAVDDEALAPAPPQIGPYRILQPLGEGGMGVVYLAEQPTVGRRVALKSIQAGAGSREVLARFEAERKALAVLNHPNIASVFDAGEGSDGRPYFVMEYVDGEPITSYCDARGLNLAARIELFLQVLSAIEHAHAHGIVHRDIKPSNILVTEVGGAPLAKVIDFGVAKATDRRLTVQTLYTELGRVVGTPAYMSPEQTSAQGRDVDRRSDVYSLGVLLYEIIVGEPPFESLATAALEEVFRKIRDEDPPAPSTRWSRLSSERRHALAKVRAEAPDRVAKRLRGELDWMVLKAMEKEPGRRYASALELAADGKRFLAGERVTAGPPDLAYRTRRFLRRNRGAVLAAAAIGFALIAGIIVSTTLHLQSRANATLAEERLKQVLHLGDRKLLSELDAEARDSLWPVASRQIPSFLAWLDRARVLAARLEGHERGLASLKETDLVGDGLGQEWWRETLKELVGQLQRFRDSTIPTVERRLETARRVEKESLESAAPLWDEAIAAIADPAQCPAYHGLRIAPEEGLVPLGRDPVSGLYEFAHLLTGVPPTRDSEGKLIPTDDMSLVLILVPGGTFRMGATRPVAGHPEGSPNVETEVDDYCQASMTPVHDVTLDAFYISKFELTRGQWQTFTGVPLGGPNPGGVVMPQGPFPLHPVESISWAMLRQHLRCVDLDLPTEAQWEYAARAGTSTIWWTGDSEGSLSGACNVADSSNERRFRLCNGSTFDSWLDDGFPALAPIGKYRPNAFGLHDTIGNVSELVLEPMLGYSNPVLPGTGQRQGQGLGRCLRGGSWWMKARFATSARRHEVVDDYRHYHAGVRPARQLRAAR
jgi:serine/threonine protein kinase/formylglycine-generating enzyme required for sulfatase activity